MVGSTGTAPHLPSRRWRTALLTAGLLTVAATAGCASSTSAAGDGGASVGEDLTFGTSAAPTTVEPGDRRPGLRRRRCSGPTTRCVVMNGDGTFAPGLAAKWGYVGEGNMAYELTLRDGVKFSDGEAMDAAAPSRRTWTTSGARRPAPMALLLVSVDSIEVTGPLTVRLTLERGQTRA